MRLAKEKLQKQVKETKEYDAKVAHLAPARIDIDLDDGVKVNYKKVQTDRTDRKCRVWQGYKERITLIE